MSGRDNSWWARFESLVRLIVRIWALLGGAVLIALVLLTAGSAVSNLFFNKPFPADYDVVKHFVAIAAFTFMPYCQITHGNVTVDIFTEGMGDRAKAVMVVLSSLIAAALALLLLHQMWYGMFDYIEYRETMIWIRIPLWTAFPPALASLVLWFAAALVNIAEGVEGVRTGVLKV